jgi:RHS repeat-associated protein
MDRFIYNYHTLNGEQSNRLSYVVDNGIDYSSYDDIKSGQTSGNYTYNKIGELTGDAQENMILHWRTGDHKLARIERTDENSPELEFVYSPFGQRVMKIEKIRANGVFTGEVKNSFYAYDANSLSRCIHSSLTLFRRSNVTIGRQVMAIYSWNFQGSSEQVKLSEQHLYGADRLGMINRDVVVYDNGVTSYTHKEENVVHVDERGRKTFELTNHLGNVLATINDRKLYNELDGNYKSVTKSFSDYYAFGMLMPNRQGGNHGRYLFNGMEHDGEVSGDGNSYTTEFRQFDPRLGRWKSLDPLMHMFPSLSPYVAFDNNPIYYIDPYGLSAGEPEKIDRTGNDPNSGSEKAERQSQVQKLLLDGVRLNDIVFVYKDFEGANGKTGDLTYTYKTNPGKAQNVDEYYSHGNQQGVMRGGKIATFSKSVPKPKAPTEDLTKESTTVTKTEVKVEVEKKEISKKAIVKDKNHSNNTLDNHKKEEEIKPVYKDFNFNLDLDARYIAGSSTLIDNNSIRGQLSMIATLLNENPKLFLILRASTDVGKDKRGWDTPTLHGATAGELAHNRNYRIQQMLIRDFNVNPNQIKKPQLGRPDGGMKTIGRIMGKIEVK